MKQILIIILLAPLLLTVTAGASSSPRLYLGVTTDKPVYKSGEPIAIALTVLNQSTKPYQAQFTSSKVYDFYLYSDQEQLVWKWSGDKMFAMALANLKLEPKQPLTYVITFNQLLPSGKPLEPGKYRLVGEFSVKDKPLLTKPVRVELR